MNSPPLPRTLCLFLCLTISFCNGDTAAGRSTISSFGSSVSSSSSSGNGYHIATTQLSVNGRCVSTLSITGHGIRKLVDYPCRGVPSPIININQTLVVGGEYYTETPGVLIHVADLCQAEYFQDSGRPAGHVTTLSPEDCVLVKQRIVVLQEYYERWMEYYKKKQQMAQQHLQALQTNLFSALGSVFGGLPFGK